MPVFGVDTLSLDPGRASVFVAHTQWLGTDRYGLEGLRNLSKLPRAARPRPSA